MATKYFGGIRPFIMIGDCCLSLLIIKFGQPTFFIDHDQQLLYSRIPGALIHFRQVLTIRGFVLEKLVDIFNTIDAKVCCSFSWKIKVVKLIGP